MEETMPIIKDAMAKIAFILAVVLLAAWYFAGAPIPGRYQIVGGGQEAVTMVDTTTGKIRVFIARKATSDPDRDYRAGSIEFIEVTK
jgi:hypothetical protein